LAVCLKREETVIGMVHIGQRDNRGEQVHNLGYIFHPGYGGQGYATEACRAAMAYVFGKLGADSFLTGTHPDNEPSVRLLKRLGFEEGGGGEYVISREAWLTQHG
jgi:RimJ/RimL family protein N-acetyltransferase